MPKVAKRLLIIVVVLLAVFFVGSLVADRTILGQTFARVPDRTPSTIATFDDFYAPTHTRTAVEFEMEAGTLRGYVYGEENNSRGLLVFRHGIFTRHEDYLLLIEALVDKGWKVFAYDAIGCGASDGSSTIGFQQAPLDVVRALEFVEESHMADGLPVALIGHSWGAYGVAASLNFPTTAQACIALSGFADPVSIILESGEDLVGPFAPTQAPTITLLNYIDFGNNAGLSAIDGINNANIPVLVIHGTTDTTVPYETTSIIAQRDNITNPLVEYVTIDDPARSGHSTYFNAEQTQEYLDSLAAQYEALEREYDGEVPESVTAEFYASVDTQRANTPDPDFIDLLDGFLARSLEP